MRDDGHVVDAAGRAWGLPLRDFLGTQGKGLLIYSAVIPMAAPELLARWFDLVKTNQMSFVKLKVGSPHDLETLEMAREILGWQVDLRVDANCAWNDLTYARKIMRAFEAYNISWFEEPVLPDNFRGSAELAETFETPIATGEQECTRWGFRDLIEHRAAHIQHMQQALDRMNLKIHEVLSDLTGVSGLKLIEAILAGADEDYRLAKRDDFTQFAHASDEPSGSAVSSIADVA